MNGIPFTKQTIYVAVNFIIKYHLQPLVNQQDIINLPYMETMLYIDKSTSFQSGFCVKQCYITMEQEWLMRTLWSFYVGIIFAYICLDFNRTSSSGPEKKSYTKKKKMLLKHFHSGLEQTLEDTIKMSHLFDTIRSMLPMFIHQKQMQNKVYDEDDINLLVSFQI